MISVRQRLAVLGRWCRRASRFVFGQVLAEGPSLRSAKRAIAKQMATASDTYAQGAESLRKVADGLTEDDLRRYVISEAERRKSIEDKAKANLVAITVGFTVLLASLNFVGKDELRSPLSGWWGTLSFLLLVLGIVYLIYGGLKALDALQIAQVFNPSPEDESGVCSAIRKTNLLWCLKQNEKVSLLRANAVSVSYRSIRNGVISLALLILLIAGRLLLVLSYPKK